jgi:hypothetical protein
MIESKKVYKYEFLCSAVGCPLKDTCAHAKRNKDQVREVIRAPYVRKNGKFVGCKEFTR